jgi:CubicO group peptidase (beta-lactamase class C family)
VGELRLLSESSVERASQERIFDKDVVMGGVLQRRSLGFLLSTGPSDPLPPSAFGHPGMGGSVGFADPSHRLAFGYVMNKMIVGPDTRYPDLCRAVYSCLGN